MAIPDDKTIQRELLALITIHPEGRISISEAYERLAQLHPELTHEEKTQKYRNSLSHWANRVQFARLHLVREGLLYSAGKGPNSQRGYWVITPKGEERAKTLGATEHTLSIEEQVDADLASIALEEHLEEGGKTARLVAIYERNPQLRILAIKYHGKSCKVCGFNFFNAYGDHGKDYIEVHHLTPVSTRIKPATIDPAKDLTVLCANCHRMVHRKRDKPLSPDELIEIVNEHSLNKP